MDVVVVGAGQAGLQVAASLRDHGHDGRVVLLGAEDDAPYQRPPLSKHYLGGPGGSRSVALRGPAWFAEHGIDLRTGTRVSAIDRAARSVRLADGTPVGYDHLVLALGARPRRLPVPGADLTGVVTLRSLPDAEALRLALARDVLDVVVIGAGFLGLELAAAARTLGHTVTVVERAAAVLPGALSAPTADALAAAHRQQGTTLLLDRRVEGFLGRDGAVRAVQLADGTRLAADLVVVAVGAVPRTGLARAAGLAVGDGAPAGVEGVEVDAALTTTDPAIRAVGDCAAFPCPVGGARIRVESVQNAVDQARFVAASLLGTAAGPTYSDLPWFWTSQHGLTVQIAGRAAGRDRTRTLGDPGSGRFSTLRFGDGVLRCVESVNRPAEHLAARRLLAAGTVVTAEVAGRADFALC
jgi:3-phenylpropionate/trans-cinnamate dioxygenase ferredoxin reductase component